MTLIPLDRKQLILEDAKERILENHTLEQIAQTHKITKRTLISTTLILFQSTTGLASDAGFGQNLAASLA